MRRRRLAMAGGPCYAEWHGRSIERQWRFPGSASGGSFFTAKKGAYLVSMCAHKGRGDCQPPRRSNEERTGVLPTLVKDIVLILLFLFFFSFLSSESYV